MTVKELKQQLDAYPDDMIVVIPGYEEGFDDIINLETIKVCYKPSAWYYGDYRNDYPIYSWTEDSIIKNGDLPEVDICCLKSKSRYNEI